MATSRRRLLLSGAALAMTASLALSACSSSGSDGSAKQGPVSDADLQAALDAGGTIKVWAWEPTLKQVAADFQKKYPKVKIELVNAGTGDKEYTALQNAMSAGAGLPDVAQIEYYALPQFSLANTISDLSGYGAGKLDGTFTPGPWNAVHSGNGVYALPMDSGPMALFYNKEVFDKYKIAVPTTWEEYAAAARTLHQADPKTYIAADTGDAGFTTSMIWQAGGKPYRVDGDKVKIDFAGDAGTQKFTALWQQLVSDKVVSPTAAWSDDWFRGLGDGSIATVVTGAWMPANLESGAKGGAGKWRVAPMPQWQAGGKATAENGGSSLTIPSGSANKKLAYAFLKYATVDEGVKTRVDAGAFPATTAALDSDAFRSAAPEYFGGQKINEVLGDSAKNVVPGWSYLPFQVYANSVFADTVGKAYVSGTTLNSGLQAWQDASAKYGQKQGFSVNK